MFPQPTDAEFAKAAELHRRGDLLEAERACRRTLEQAPHHFGAHYLLGIIALQRGAFADAERSIGLALTINPNVASAQRHHGVALFRIGRPEDALASFTRALALNSDDAESFSLRGNVLHELGRFEEALSDHDSALALKPELAVGHNNRGLALRSLDRLDQALASIERAIALNPNYAAAHKNRGDVLRAMKRPADALVSYDRAIALNPDFARAFHDRGIALAELGRPLDAIASYDEAIARDPTLAASFNNRGNVLQELERFEDALESYDAAIAASPVLAEGWYNRGVVLLELKRPNDALASHARAIALRPDYPEAHVARGFCKLALGLFDTGWRDFENRWRVKTYPPLLAPTDAPLWSGEDLRDRSILVCWERGSGDIVQFSRFVPLLAERGAQVAFLVPEKLRRILAALPETVRVMSTVAAIGSVRFSLCTDEPAPMAGRDAGRQSASDSLPCGRCGTVSAMETAHRRARVQDRHLLAGRALARRGCHHRPCNPTLGIPSAFADRRRSPHQPAKGTRRRTARDFARRHDCRNAGRGFRCGTRCLRRHGRGDGASRSDRHLRYVDRPCRGRARPADLDRAEACAGMALDARRRDDALVSDRAPVPSEDARRLGRRVRGDGVGAEDASAAAAFPRSRAGTTARTGRPHRSS